MSYETILFDKEGGIATITLNRPDKLNAYTPLMGDEVVDAFRSVQRDEAVHAIILTGAGRAFCAGADLEVLKAHAAGEDTSRGKGPKLGEEDFIHTFPLEIRDSPKPVIAAINGHAVGVGMTMVMPCDIRVVAEDAKLGFAFARLGILPGLGTTHLLPNLVGMAKAQELVLTADNILGAEGEKIGLVNKAVPRDQVVAEARALAEKIAAIEPVVLAYAKQALHYGADHSMAEAMKNENAQGPQLKAARERAKAERG
jgi:2-(1,2-epoxy-1,2-dihydrophenyl)acetyl-CoA isomerase